VTRQLRWSRDALDDFKRQIAHIAADNPIAARRVADRVQATVAALGEFATGRPGRVSGTYEKPVPGLPFIIAYTITVTATGETVVILRMIHGARDWPDETWPA
jgi:plasmid stabilization system protein ParE